VLCRSHQSQAAALLAGVPRSAARPWAGRLKGRLVLSGVVCDSFYVLSLAVWSAGFRRFLLSYFFALFGWVVVVKYFKILLLYWAKVTAWICLGVLVFCILLSLLIYILYFINPDLIGKIDFISKIKEAAIFKELGTTSIPIALIYCVFMVIFLSSFFITPILTALSCAFFLTMRVMPLIRLRLWGLNRRNSATAPLIPTCEGQEIFYALLYILGLHAFAFLIYYISRNIYLQSGHIIDPEILETIFIPILTGQLFITACLLFKLVYDIKNKSLNITSIITTILACASLALIIMYDASYNERIKIIYNFAIQNTRQKNSIDFFIDNLRWVFLIGNIFAFVTLYPYNRLAIDLISVTYSKKKERKNIGLLLGNDYQVEIETHLLTIAGTGGGKTQGQVLPNLLDNPETSFLVIDPKGITAAKSAAWRKTQDHKIVIFNPYKEQAEELAERGFSEFQSFNPLANLDPESEHFSSDVRYLAEALIYEAEGSGKHFADAARGFVSFLIKYLVTEPEEIKTFARLYQLVRGGVSYLDDQQIFEKAAASSCASVQDGWRRWATGRGEVVDAIATAETQLAFLDNPAICQALEGEPFNFADMKWRKMTVYLILPFDKLITDEVRFLRLILLVAMSQFYRAGKQNPYYWQTPEHIPKDVVVILDEFGNLGPLHMIKNGMGAIREYGVKLWPFVQNLKQLQELYPQGWEHFIANASAISLFAVNSVETAEYFSRRAARRIVEKTTHHKNPSTGNESKTTSEHWEDALPVSDIYELPEDQLFIFRQGKAMPDKAKKLAAWRDDPFKYRQTWFLRKGGYEAYISRFDNWYRSMIFNRSVINQYKEQ